MFEFSMGVACGANKFLYFTQEVPFSCYFAPNITAKYLNVATFFQDSENYANILKPIAQQEDFSELYDLTSDYKNDELFSYLHDKMNDIMADHGLHPKDNMEDIEMRLMDELKDDYGIAEASELDIMKKNAGIQSEEEVAEGGNDFDIAMGEAESIISDASSDEQAKADLQKLHDMQDDSYAKSTVADYIARLEKEGLSAMQRELAMADMAGESTQEAIDPQTQTTPQLARIKELISYKL